MDAEVVILIVNGKRAHASTSTKKNLLHARPDLIEEIRLLFTVYLFETYVGDIRTVQCFATWVRWEDTTTTTTWE